MPKQTAKKKAGKKRSRSSLAKKSPVSSYQFNQVSLQIWVAIATIVIFLIVLFYQLLTNTLPEEKPANLLPPDQRVKALPIQTQPLSATPSAQ